MGSFLTGLAGGYADEATNMKKGDQKSLRKTVGKIMSRKKNSIASQGVGGTKGNPYFSESDGGGGDSDLQSFKRGGRVKRTGLARVHKGERVLTKKQQRKMGMERRRGGGKRR